MLYKIAHVLRDRVPWVWDGIEIINSFLFQMRYGKLLRKVESEALTAFDESAKCKGRYGYKAYPMRDITTQRIVEFFNSQPQEAFRFFNPHGFDENHISKLQRNKAFLGYIIIDSEANQVAGYCFNRSFFHGKSFRGRMVDIHHRGRGLGTMMNRLLNRIGFGIGLKLFETVSEDNVPSYKSAVSASGFKVIKKLPHNELYLEIFNDMKRKNNKPAGGVINK